MKKKRAKLRKKESVSVGNRVAGVIILLFGLFIGFICFASISDYGDVLNQRAAIASGVLTLILVLMGAIIGFRDFLPKRLTQMGMFLFGLLAIIVGVISSIGLIYALLYDIEGLQLEEGNRLRLKRLFMPFSIPICSFAVGCGFLMKAFGQNNDD